MSRLERHWSVAMEFYVYLNGVRRGPFPEERVRSYLATGLLQPTDLASTAPDGELRSLTAFQQFNVERPDLLASAASEAAGAPDNPRLTPPTPAPNPDACVASLAPEALGPYASATLAPNETPYYKTSLHWIIFVRFAFLALALFFFLALPFAIGVQALTGSQLGWFVLPFPTFLMLAPTLAYVSSELVITDMRVLIKTGIIQRQTLEIFIAKVESISIDQGFGGRLFDYGTVTIRGTGAFAERFEAIAHPLELRNWVQRLQRGGTSVRGPATVAP